MRALPLLSLVLCAAPSAQAQNEPEVNEDARAAYQEAARAYNAGDFAQAAAAFERAYELSHRPNMLFNVAQAYRLAGPSHCTDAYRYYTRYLEEERAPSNRKEVEDRLLELAPCAPRPAQAPLPAVPPSATPAPSVVTEVPPNSHRAARWLFFGAGALLATGALVLGSSQAELQTAQTHGIPSNAPALSGWYTAQSASFVLLGAGALGVAAGVVSLRF